MFTGVRSSLTYGVDFTHLYNCRFYLLLMVISLLKMITIWSSFIDGQALKAFIAAARLIFSLFFVV
jgi:hypothetical protein